MHFLGWLMIDDDDNNKMKISQSYFFSLTLKINESFSIIRIDLRTFFSNKMQWELCAFAPISSQFIDKHNHRYTKYKRIERRLIHRTTNNHTLINRFRSSHFYDDILSITIRWIRVGIFIYSWSIETQASITIIIMFMLSFSKVVSWETPLLHIWCRHWNTKWSTLIAWWWLNITQLPDFYIERHIGGESRNYRCFHPNRRIYFEKFASSHHKCHLMKA